MFKEKFKYYKSKILPPDLSTVISFDKLEENELVKIFPLNPAVGIFPGLLPIVEWNAYTLLCHPGLILIKNPFTTSGQRYWAARCLRDYTKTPSKKNIDAHGYIADDADWWQLCKEIGNEDLTWKLRWATLGYHYNWDFKEYYDNVRSHFPFDLAALAKYLANSIYVDDYVAEAAIVNFYHLDSTLSGHTDHSEKDLDAPLFSLSFGQSAVFLIGGCSLNDETSAILLHSGDILVMSRESRLSYHGVPKIISTCSHPWNNGDVTLSELSHLDSTTVSAICNDCEWQFIHKYLTVSRININIRKVFPNTI